MSKAASERGNGTFISAGNLKDSSFKNDYFASTLLLRERMDRHFPEDYHDRLTSEAYLTYSRGEVRLVAVDTVSMAISMALQNGATVEDAAEEGAASVGI